LDEKLTLIWTIIKVAVGIGFVVFVHELGHFLLAKWNGVKVERFSIGFGRTLISYRRGVGVRVGTGSRPPGPGDPPTYGETEYVLAALPLGGFVKMLGESLEDPTEKAEKSDDPRSFNQKSVFARMQIITAGVIMNLILAVFCFAFVYSQGWTDLAARIGGVIPGDPAYKAGMRAGDDIVAIDGRRNIGFLALKQRVGHSGAGQKIDFTIKRPGSETEQTLSIEPLRDPDFPLPTIGVLPAESLELASKIPFQALPGQKVDPARPLAGFEGGDKVIAVGPEGGPLEPVEDFDEFIHKADRIKDRPMVVEIERKKVSKAGVEEKSIAKLTVPPHNFVDFGFRLAPGPIAAIRDNSPAQKAGFKEGDRIIALDGQQDFDPMSLPDKARASAGKPMKLTIERPVEGKAVETLELTVTPDDSPAWTHSLGRPSPLDIPGLGLAIRVEPKILAVEDGSPAAKAGLKVGNVLQSIIITPAKTAEQKSDPKPITIELDGKTSNWPNAFSLLQQIETKSIELAFDSKKPIAITPRIDPERFHPLRGLEFLMMEKKFPPQGLVESLRRGAEETGEMAFNIITIFRSISQGRVGKDAFGGLIKIADTAYTSASVGWVTFLHFLGMLSVNLAVLNFLPIPPLDGGQFLLLTAEKVRGKPLPDWALNIFMLGGLIFVVGLVLFINGNDIYSLIKSYF
jgi:regulator of sigma E protease